MRLSSLHFNVSRCLVGRDWEDYSYDVFHVKRVLLKDEIEDLFILLVLFCVFLIRTIFNIFALILIFICNTKILF